MDPLIGEWLGLLLRWLHVIAAISWIGTSFYFVALDAGLRNPGGLPAGVAGEAWQVHGGGFYRMQKYTVAPAELPHDLTWFKWEAYTTFLSGFALLVLVYYLGAELYLIDAQVLNISPLVASVIGLASLVLGWRAYDRLCRSPLGRDDRGLALVGYVLLVAVAFAYAHVFSGRGALIHMGSLIGTIMVANVFFVIIPNQRRVVADLIAHRQPDPELGRQARQRSLHNNYLTLPVLFAMLGGHYPLVFGTGRVWLVFAVVLLVGGLIRHFFNARHHGHASPWWTWGAAAAGMAAVVWLAWPRSASTLAADVPVDPVEIENIVLSRCSMCHAEEPLWPGLAVPPKGVILDTAERIDAQRHAIALQAAWSEAMPPGNLTELTDEERATLAAWATR
jgi:uncharacterized membrane protein